MAGGVQLTQQQLDQQRKQQIIGDLHKTAEKSGALKLSPERLVSDSSQYGKSMSRASRFISVLGIKRLFHRDKDETPSSLKTRAAGQSEMRLDVEKELSYQQKTSKQEEAARRRGEYTYSLYTGQNAAAQNALTRYTTDQANGDLDLDVEVTGDEFADMKLLDTDQDDVEKSLYDIMRFRDKLKQDIAGVEKDPYEGMVLYTEHLKQNLACTEDALKTMYLANGLSLDGKAVTKKQIEKAKEHLPLALEKYQFMLRNDARRFGQDIVKVLRKSDDWKAGKETARRDDEDASRRGNRILGVPAGYEGMYDAVQNLITSHPDEYKAHKKQIDKVFSRFTQCLKKIDEMDVDESIAGGLLMDMNGEAASLARQGVERIGNRNAEVKNLLVYQAESAQALIDHILTGTKTDVLHGEFIEKTWGIKAYDEDLTHPLNETLDEYKAVSDAYKNRVKDLRQAVTAEHDPVKLRVLQTALRKLEAERDRGCAEKADALAYTDADALEGAILKEKVFGTPAYVPFAALPAFARMADSMSPIEGRPAFDETELRSYAHKMAIVKTGRDMDGNDADDGAKTEALTSVLGYCLDQAVEVERYVQGHPEMFERRDPYSAMRNWSGMPRFEKKALGVASAMETLIESPLFTELNEADRKDFVDQYDRIQRMAKSAGELVFAISRYERDSAAEYAENPMNHRFIGQADYRNQTTKYRNHKLDQYSDPSYRRTYHPVLPAQAG